MDATNDKPQGHSRREFIRRILLTTVYVAPAIVSFSVTGVASAQPADPSTAGSTPPGQAKRGGRMRSPMNMGMGMSGRRGGGSGRGWSSWSSNSGGSSGKNDIWK